MIPLIRLRLYRALATSAVVGLLAAGYLIFRYQLENRRVDTSKPPEAYLGDFIWELENGEFLSKDALSKNLNIILVSQDNCISAECESLQANIDNLSSYVYELLGEAGESHVIKRLHSLLPPLKAPDDWIGIKTPISDKPSSPSPLHYKDAPSIVLLVDGLGLVRFSSGLDADFSLIDFKRTLSKELVDQKLRNYYHEHAMKKSISSKTSQP